MSNYEGLIMAKTGLKADEEKALVSQIKEILSKNEGKISNFQEWGKKRLSYRIKKQEEANYYLVDFQVPALKLANIEKAFMLSEKILRFMFLKKSEREGK